MNTNHKFYQSITLLALTTGFLLMIPLIAMQFTDEVVWTLSDFILAGTLLFGTGLTYKLATRNTGEIIYRIAIGFALFTGLFLIWVNLAVGIIGSEDNPVNLLYFGVFFLGIIGALIARFQSQGMELTMFAMALTQALVTVIVLIGGFYQSPPSTVFHIISVNGFFITLYILSALLFRYDAKGNKSTSTI
ncbi:hypothetical protein [Aliifodinibius salipaludis]|uniref:hypothetical protein n=1 Tax=Fodinibius salipaludis TaxID=2032627 RepID=UPI001C3EBB0B|nr:hypothetical protein [Aliifodinibius salipaludis]